MDRWLGDGGMALIGAVGGSFESYGVDGEDLGWVTGNFLPSELACNPHGSVQAGVHALLLDAAMNFSINAALVGRDRTQGTIEMTTELLRPALLGENYQLRGDVVRLTRQIAYGEATLTSAEDKLVSRASGTFLVQRDERD
jgi:acyl-coenzyme A thioesterase PaaI-like protein